jgi:hypothetical protein
MMIARGASTVTLRREGLDDAEVLAVQIRLSSTSEEDRNLSPFLRRFLLIGEDVPARFLPLRPNVDVLVISGKEWTITGIHVRPHNVAYEVELEGVG